MAKTANPLTDLLPARYRKWVYRVAAAAFFVFGIWQLADGDWQKFLVGLVSSLVPGLAASNTFSPESDVAVEAAVDPGHYLDGHRH
jgi:hypothetical protein